jgi:hypothetical protein
VPPLADQVAELSRWHPTVQEGIEAGITYYLLPGLHLPKGCTPDVADGLLCPSPRDGYPSRLFLDRQVTTATPRNWNASNVRLFERNWFAVSWKVNPSLRLAQMIAAHLEAFR